MNYRSKLTVMLLAGASMLTGGAAMAAQTDASSPEIIQMTTADQGSGGGSTSNVGSIVVQGAGEALGSGYIVPEDGAKERSTVTRQGIENLLPSANPFQAISILPGVNQFQDDAVGLSGGTIRVRGLVAAQMGFTINGAPVNDSGNFAIYPQEYVDAENLEQVWVTQGSTDIDAPHVGASGGNIGIVTRTPSDTFNVRMDGAGGENSYARGFVSVDTGWIGNFKGFVSFSHATADKWRGDGSDRRNHSDGNLLFQFLPHSSIGLIWLYNDGFNNFYRSYSRTTVNGSPESALQFFNTYGNKVDYDTFWGTVAHPLSLSSSSGVNPSTNINNPNFPGFTTNQTNYWPLEINPFHNAVVTMPLHVQLADDLRWETTGYFWYGSGGGGFGSTLTEGGFVNGYKVPTAYGDVASGNTILLYKSSVTRTFRPGITSKVIYDMDNFTFTGGLWAEHAEHRQTAPYSTVNTDGNPCDAWLTDTNSNGCVLQSTAGGAAGIVEGRDFKTVSVGQAVFGEVQGRFLNDDLKITAGLAERDIHRSMYNYLPVCAVNNSYCGINGQSTLATLAASSTFLNSSAYTYFGGLPGATLAQEEATYQRMQSFAGNPHANWHALLPEFNATYDIDTNQQLFAGMMKDFRTPSNFVFSSFNSSSNPTIMQIGNVASETSWSYETGYRFHGDFLTGSATVWLHDLSNYQASAQISPVDFTTVNIGGVKIYGIDAEVGTKPWNGLTFYMSGELENSRLGSNIAAAASGNTIEFIATKGKELVDTPRWIISATMGYENDGFFGSLTPQCKARRATSLLNDEYIPSLCTVDASIGYRFDPAWGSLNNATIQLYANNLFDQKYLGEITTQAQTNSLATTSTTGVAVSGQSYSALPGAPLFVGVKLNLNVGQ